MSFGSYYGNGNSFNQNPYKLINRRIDNSAVKKLSKRSEVMIGKSSELDIHKNYVYRAGVIVFTRIGEEKFFCLGIDTQSGNLTDFGGGVKKYETVIEGGLREFEEESQNVFIDYEYDPYNQLSVYSNNMAIIFIEISNLNPEKIAENFIDKLKLVDYSNLDEEPEVCGLVWLSTSDFINKINNPHSKLYIKVKDHLKKVTSTIKNM